MQTVRGRGQMINTGLSGIRSSVSQVPDSPNQVKRMKIREFISWSVCFALIFGLTGLIKVLKLGITMDAITSILFYTSLAALVFFVSKIISLSKNSSGIHFKNTHELN
jgi:hypothetical protein